MVMTASDPHDKHSPESATRQRQHESLIRWRCPNCGQMHFTVPDDEPPDICAYCSDMTTWQRLQSPDD